MKVGARLKHSSDGCQASRRHVALSASTVPQGILRRLRPGLTAARGRVRPRSVCVNSRGTIAGWYDTARLAHHATVEQHVVYSLTEAEIVIVRILHRNHDAAGKVVS
jgi:hypothetical protein